MYIPEPIQITAKGTRYEGEKVFTYLVGERQYYCPQYGMLFTRNADGTFNATPKKHSYYDEIWQQYVEDNPFKEVYMLLATALIGPSV